MMDSHVPRIPKTWLGLLLGAGCMVAGAGEPAALSVTSSPFLPKPILIQEQPETTPDAARGQVPAETTPGAAAAGSFTELNKALAAARERLEELSKAAEAVAATGQLRQELAAIKEENEQLVAEIEALRAGDKDMVSARQAAEARVVELSEAMEEATGRARQIDDELVAVRWQNAQLNTSLAQTRAAREELAAEARQTQETLSARIEALETEGAETAAVIARLREQLEQREQQLAAARSAEAGAATQLAEMRNRSQQAEQKTTRVTERLTVVEEQLSAAEEQAASAQQDRAQLEQRAALLEAQVVELREAVGTATDVARQNLIAVEQRISELNEAFRVIAPAADASAFGPSPSDENSATAAVSDNGSNEEAATDPATSEADPTVETVQTANARQPSDQEGSFPLLSDLPLEQRLHVQGLLADLKGTVDEQGLKLVVPGGVLFALNSEDVQESAHGTLAKVAELIDMYKDRKVRIIGHTDALGDAAYNEELSERRAGLVKQFFVENFDVDETRLSTQGVGEADPIASNETLEGRRANRRVEVLILN